MDQQWIETFIDLMETQSFNRTAERLEVKQSTVSHRIKALEGELGRALFLRNRSGTIPTTAGNRFLNHALALRHEWRQAVRQVETVGSHEATLRLGIQHDVADVYTARIVREIRNKLTGTALYVEVDYSTQMSEDLLTGELDLALVFTPRHSLDIHIEHVGDMSFAMVSHVPRNLADISTETYVFPNVAPAFARLHNQVHPRLGEAPLASGQPKAVCDLIEATGGASYISVASARQKQASGIFHIVPDAPILTQPVYAAVHVRNRHLAAHARILAVFRSVVAAS